MKKGRVRHRLVVGFVFACFVSSKAAATTPTVPPSPTPEVAPYPPVPTPSAVPVPTDSAAAEALYVSTARTFDVVDLGGRPAAHFTLSNYTSGVAVSEDTTVAYFLHNTHISMVDTATAVLKARIALPIYASVITSLTDPAQVAVAGLDHVAIVDPLARRTVAEFRLDLALDVYANISALLALTAPEHLVAIVATGIQQGVESVSGTTHIVRFERSTGRIDRRATLPASYLPSAGYPSRLAAVDIDDKIFVIREDGDHTSILSVIDPVSLEVLTETPFRGRAKDLVVSRGRAFVLTQEIGLLVIDPLADEIRSIPGTEVGSGLELGSLSRRIYIPTTDTWQWRVLVLDLDTLSLIGQVYPPNYPWNVYVVPRLPSPKPTPVAIKQTCAYIADVASRSLLVANIDSGRVTSRIALKAPPLRVGLSGDGSSVYVLQKRVAPRRPHSSSHLKARAWLAKIDTRAKALVGAIEVEGGISQLSVDRDSAEIYLARDVGRRVTVVDGETLQVKTRFHIAVHGQIVAAPNGPGVYVPISTGSGGDSRPRTVVLTDDSGVEIAVSGFAFQRESVVDFAIAPVGDPNVTVYKTAGFAGLGFLIQNAIGGGVSSGLPLRPKKLAIRNDERLVIMSDDQLTVGNPWRPEGAINIAGDAMAATTDEQRLLVVQGNELRVLGTVIPGRWQDLVLSDLDAIYLSDAELPAQVVDLAVGEVFEGCTDPLEGTPRPTRTASMTFTITPTFTMTPTRSPTRSRPPTSATPTTRPAS